jgi:hypothetical protein
VRPGRSAPERVYQLIRKMVNIGAKGHLRVHEENTALKKQKNSQQ